MAQTTLDITAEHCPMTFVKVKLALSRLAAGDILDVVLTGDEPLRNVPRAAGEQGHTVLSITEDNGIARVRIQKGT